MQPYIDKAERAYPFCPGCTHGVVLDAVGRALQKRNINPQKAVLVSDIGCVGLADQYFKTHTFHGLHGRSFTYASGIKMANPALEVFVLVGDGGCGIGGHHLINAARRNIGINVICFNNFNFGMTGGQQSVTTPAGGKTNTTFGGSLERPFDLCSLVASAGASFVARKTAFEKDLDQTIAEGFEHKGFSFIEVMEICAPYYATMNNFKKIQIEDYLKNLNLGTGILHQDSSAEFSEKLQNLTVDPTIKAPQAIEKKFEAHLKEENYNILIAGDAGMKILSAAANLSKAALLCGLWALERDDYPVTVQSGYCTSLIKLSKERLNDFSESKPQATIILSENGLKSVEHSLSHLTAKDLVIYTKELSSFETKGQRLAIDFKAARVRETNRAIAALAFLLSQQEIFPIEAFRSALEDIENEKIRSENLLSLNTGIQMQGDHHG